MRVLLSTKDNKQRVVVSALLITASPVDQCPGSGTQPSTAGHLLGTYASLRSPKVCRTADSYPTNQVNRD